jgi:hypothetical protein
MSMAGIISTLRRHGGGRGYDRYVSQGKVPSVKNFSDTIGKPAGLTPAEIRDLLGVDRSLADTCLGMRKYGLIQRVGRGKYVAAAASDTDRREGGHA